jgi:flavin-dependent dehydrogenase
MAAFPRTDVFVIGGGPAGLAAAIAARRKGFSVTVADAREPAIDKACGEGLLPDALAAARILGVDFADLSSFGVRGIRFHDEGTSVQADFPARQALGVRRTVLHQAFVDQAMRCGVNLRWGSPVNNLDQIAARWVIGADGTASLVRRWAGLDAMRRDSRRFGFRRHFRIAPWSPYVEIHWGDDCQIYITPVAMDEVGVAVISASSKLRVSDAIAQFPALAARFDGRKEASGERGAVTATRSLHRVTRGNVALIGDASGSVDAISGEGLSLAFRQSLALADAMEKDDLAAYEAEHRRLGARPRFMADFMLLIGKRRWLRRRAMAVLPSRPELFQGFLAMHVGAARPRDFAADCAELGWRMLVSS